MLSALIPALTGRLNRCVASDVSADLHQRGEHLDGNRQIFGDGAGEKAELAATNGSFGDTLGSTGGGLEQGEVGVDMKASASVVQEYDRKKKLAGDLGNGFVRFNLSPAKVGVVLCCTRTVISCIKSMQYIEDALDYL